MSFIQEFKKFALRGSVVDLAIGVIIGAAFGSVVTSLVNDVIMPPIGLLLGGVDFSDLAITIKAPTADHPGVLIKYGSFINALVNFGIIAFVIFAVVKGMNKILPPAIEEPKTRECPECLMSVPAKAKKCGHCQSQL